MEGPVHPPKEIEDLKSFIEAAKNQFISERELKDDFLVYLGEKIIQVQKGRTDEAEYIDKHKSLSKL